MTNQSVGDSRGDGELYVITLCTASLPMVLRVPFVHELVGFSVFRSRTVEDGRERFRLCVGYFDSATRAHEALAVVRKHYPSAWISCAPKTGLGSLDDTMNTAFNMIRRATATVVAPTAAAGPGEAGRPAVEPPPPQRYVVQLDWGTEAVPSARIPQLALLRAYNLYRALVTREDGTFHALRLGFFKDVHGARQVAEYVRVHFPRVGVVPVSHREYCRALELLETRAARRAEAAASRTTAAAATPPGPQEPGGFGEQLLNILRADPRTAAKAGAPPAEPAHTQRKIRSW